MTWFGVIGGNALELASGVSYSPRLWRLPSTASRLLRHQDRYISPPIQAAEFFFTLINKTSSPPRGPAG
jgi:hypothetical protein